MLRSRPIWRLVLGSCLLIRFKKTPLFYSPRLFTTRPVQVPAAAVQALIVPTPVGLVILILRIPQGLLVLSQKAPIASIPFCRTCCLVHLLLGWCKTFAGLLTLLHKQGHQLRIEPSLTIPLFPSLRLQSINLLRFRLLRFNLRFRHLQFNCLYVRYPCLLSYSIVHSLLRWLPYCQSLGILTSKGLIDLMVVLLTFPCLTLRLRIC